jgi:hypothetical protein
MQIALPAVNWGKAEIGPQMRFCQPHIALNIVFAPRSSATCCRMGCARPILLRGPTEAADKRSGDPFGAGIAPP